MKYRIFTTMRRTVLRGVVSRRPALLGTPSALGEKKTFSAPYGRENTVLPGSRKTDLGSTLNQRFGGGRAEIACFKRCLFLSSGRPYDQPEHSL